jgi:hypothetical protein
MQFSGPITFGVAVVIMLSGCSSENRERDEGNKVRPVFDLHVVAKSSCMIGERLEKYGAKLRNNAPSFSDRASTHVYGPMSYADAERGKASVLSLKCAESVQTVRSRRGDLCPSC